MQCEKETKWKEWRAVRDNSKKENKNLIFTYLVFLWLEKNL